MISRSDPQPGNAMAVRKELSLAVAPEVAFRVFTEGIATWWPAKTHSVGEERVAAVVLEPRVGGRFFERLDDGTEHEWGRVTAWEPPGRLACTWYASRGPDTAQQLEVRFEPQEGGTRVVLEQTGWELLGERAEEVRSSYSSEGGWDLVLGCFAAEAERSG